MTRTIKENIDEIRERIAAAATKSGRSPDEVTLVAVSKVHPASVIRDAYDAGQRHFGENYAQELFEKHGALGNLADLKWHFIGHLQRNKAKLAVATGAIVETVDSPRLVEVLNRQAEREHKTIHLLIQVNVGAEPQKSGIAPETLPGLIDDIECRDHLQLNGLMTIPPYDLDSNETRKYFEALRKLRDNCGGAPRLPHLSMGMSHDFEAAVEEGATHVRVGTAIFGTRPPKR